MVGLCGHYSIPYGGLVVGLAGHSPIPYGGLVVVLGFYIDIITISFNFRKHARDIYRLPILTKKPDNQHVHRES